jgi:hypothetical protein
MNDLCVVQIGGSFMGLINVVEFQEAANRREGVRALYSVDAER